MSKTAEVRARITPEKKARAEKILANYGLTHSAFINISYANLLNGGVVPISGNIPNAETERALAEPVKDLKSYDNLDLILEEVGKLD